MKKILALILAMVMCFSLLAACGSKDDAQNTGSGTPGTSGSATNSGNSGGSTIVTTEGLGKTDGEVGKVDTTVKYRDTVKLTFATGITNGAFYSSTSAIATSVSNMTHQALTIFNYETGKAEPELAESWKDVNNDGLVWEFKLKEGITFHKGDKHYGDLKASDVKWTYEWAAPNGPGVDEGAVLRTITQMNQMDRIETTGDNIVTFYLKDPIFDLPEMLAVWNILSEAAVKEFGYMEGHDVGTGPYYINYPETALDQHITMTRYDDYWAGIENYATKNIVFVIHKDQTTACAALLAGEIDGIPAIKAENALQFQGNDAYKFYNYKGTNPASVFFNTYDDLGFFDGEDEPDQIKLRQAIKLALDRDALCTVMYAANRAGGDRFDSLFNPNGTGYVDFGQCEYDREKAKAMMKELGYSEANPLKLKMVHYGSYTTYAQIVQDQLKNIYIDIELAECDSSAMGTLLRSGQGWDLCVNYYGTSTTLTEVMNKSLRSTGSNAKLYGWASAEMDKRIDEVVAQKTLDDQLKAFAEFQEWANNYVPRIPTHAGNTINVMIAEVEGYVAQPTPDYTTVRIPE